MYNPALGWTKNAKIIGHSVNTIKKYILNKEEPTVAIDLETTEELETADSENLFAGRQDIDNDELCRWLFGDELIENIEREKERNARIHGT